MGASGAPGRGGSTIALVVMIGVVCLAILLNGAFTLWEVQASQHRWCSALVTLDNADQAALKAPPATRPKGAYSFALIKDFHNLREGFGCG